MKKIRRYRLASRLLLPRSRGRALGRALWIVGGVLTAFLLLVLLTPTLLSTAPGRNYILGRLNANLAGKLQAQTLSVGWWSGVQLKDVRLTDSDGADVAGVPAIDTRASLWGLMGGKLELGKVTIERPVVNLRLNEQGRIAWEKIVKPWAATVPPKAPSLPYLVADLHVVDGELNITGMPELPPLHLTKIDLVAGVNTFDRPVSTELALTVGAQGQDGSVHLAGDIDNLREVIVAGATPTARFTVQVARLDTAPFVSLGRMAGLTLDWKGTLDSDTKLTLAAGRVEFAGHTDLAGLDLTGGPLGPDRLQLARLTVPYDVAWSGDGLTLRKLELHSDLADATLSGQLAAGPGGLWRFDQYKNLTLQGNAEADVAGLARMLPHTLRLTPGLTFTAGRATVRVDGKSSAGTIDAQLYASLANLRAQQDGTEWVQPKDVVLQADLERKTVDGQSGLAQLEVKDLKFSSGFAELAGSGSLQNFTMNGEVDLTAFSEQLAHVARTGVDFAGRCTFNLTTVGDPQKVLDVKLQLDGQDVLVRGLLEKPLTQKKVVLTADAQLTTPEGKGLPEQFRLRQFELAGDNVRIKGTAQGDLVARLAAVQSFDLTADADLAPLMTEVGALLPLPAGMALAGKSQLACSGGVTGQSLRLDKLTADAAGFSLTLPSYPRNPITQPSAHLAAQGTWDLGTKSVDLAALAIATPEAQIDLKSVRLARYDAADRQLTVADLAVNVDTQLESFAKNYGPMLGLPSGLVLVGRQQFTCSGSLSPDSLRLSALKAESSDLVLAWAARAQTPLRQASLRLDASGVSWDWKKRLVLDGSWSWRQSTVALGALKAEGDFGKAELAKVNADLAGKTWHELLKTVESFNLDVSQDLASASAQFGPLVGFPARLKLQGGERLRAAGSLTADQLLVKSISSTTQNLVLALPGRTGTPFQQKQLNLSSEATWSIARNELSLSKLNATGDFGRADLAGVLMDLSAATAGGKVKSVASFDVDVFQDLATVANQFGTMLGLPAGSKISGSEKLVAVGNYTPQRGLELSKVTSTTRDLVLTLPNRPPIQHPELVLVGSGRCLWPQLIETPSLQVAGSFGRATITQARIENFGTDRMTAQAQVNAVARLQDLTRWFGPFAGISAQSRYEGLQTLTSSVSTEGGHVLARGTNVIDNLVVSQPDMAEVREPKVSMTYDLDLFPGQAAGSQPAPLSLRMKAPFTISSGMLSLSASGGITDLAGRRDADLTGSASYDVAKVMTVLAPWLPEGLSATGRRQNDQFVLKGPLSGKSFTDVMRGLQGRMTVGVDQVSYGGLTSGKVETTAVLGNGLLQFGDLATTVNGGTLKATPVVDFRSQYPILKTVGQPVTVSGLVLSDTVTSEWLGQVNPIFFRPGRTSGLLDATVSSLAMPLSRVAALKQGVMTAQVSIRQLDMEVGGFLAQLIAVLGRRPSRITGDIPAFDVALANDRFSYDRLQVKMSDMDLLFSGWVGFSDDRLNLNVSVPVTAEMIGSKDLAAKLQGTRLTIPITGTLSSPELNLGGFTQQMQKLLLEAGIRSLLGNN